MKKALSLILAVMMLLGCMSVTAFADGNTTDITATVPDITYNIVIPAKTALTEENHTDILLGGDTGKATVEITAHPSDTVNIYYTVDLTAGDLTDGNDHTITTSYTYAQGGDYSELTADTKVTVYTGGKVVDSTIKVTADNDQWKAAPSGDYTASIVFNFAKEEVKKVTIADILPNPFPTEELSSNWSNNMACHLWVADGNLNAKGGWETSVPVSTELTLVGDKYTCTTDTDVWTFTMDGESFCKATISDSTVEFELNGDYTQAK